MKFICHAANDVGRLGGVGRWLSPLGGVRTFDQNFDNAVPMTCKKGGVFYEFTGRVRGNRKKVDIMEGALVSLIINLKSIRRTFADAWVVVFPVSPPTSAPTPPNTRPPTTALATCEDRTVFVTETPSSNNSTARMSL
jgi:hypothetical protein